MKLDKDKEILLMPPGEGKCPKCAAQHKPDEPHEIRSLYYLMKFWQKEKRFPTTWDTVQDCPEDVIERWRERLGIPKDEKKGDPCF
jgi:hypothetical protein